MAKIHYFQRYSSIENTVTNNTLQLFARIYGYSTQQASKLLADLTGEPIEIGIEINQQERAAESVPDGIILQRSFKVLIESKVDSGVNFEQLARHAKSFSAESQKILLLLTKQKLDAAAMRAARSAILRVRPSVVFRNVTYEEVCKHVSSLFKEYEYEMTALVDDYVEYCNDSDLVDQAEHLMRIVPCGESVEINNRHGIYFHPSDRGYTKHSYVGIYANKRVGTLWKIDSIFDVTYRNGKLTKELVQGRETNDYDEKIISIIGDAYEECGYEIAENHRFFCGQKVESTDFRKSTSGGIQGARFINLLDKIGPFADASEAASKLRGMTWE